PVEDAPRFDPAVEDVREQLLDVRADRGGAAADREVVVERRLRGGDRLVMGDTDAADGATRTGNADRGEHRLVGADTLEHGVDAEAAGQLAHPRYRRFTAFAHDVRRAERFRERDAIGMPAQKDDPLGAEAARGD